MGYEYYSDEYPDIWNKKICHLKKSLNGFVNATFVTAGKSFYVCSTSQYTQDHAAIGQNIRSFKVHYNNDIKVLICIICRRQTHRSVWRIASTLMVVLASPSRKSLPGAASSPTLSISSSRLVTWRARPASGRPPTSTSASAGTTSSSRSPPSSPWS